MIFLEKAKKPPPMSLFCASFTTFGAEKNFLGVFFKEIKELEELSALTGLGVKADTLLLATDDDCI